ncbi:mobilisation protein (MobC) [Micromonospora citrea]|uniref:Mobilisation protein (MobC) n=1 Tax=Micromonospora citrea TaxID=47855 RepID=A0A1C6TPT2_9ACTN|nr:mobilisation protein (MobC) [Micromonospora citrea]
MADPAQVGVVRFGASQRRRRAHSDDDPRVHRVTVRLSEAEMAAVEANAAAARMATSAYLAEAGSAPLVSAAGPDGAAETGPLLVELMGVHRQVRGAAHNLNQAVARLHSTGEPAGDLAATAAYLARVAARVDELVTAIAAAQTGRR